MIRLIEGAVNNRLWVFFAVVILVVAGIASTFRLPVDAVPDITNIQVVVNADTGALDPEQIEQSVTYPIETEMSVLPNVEEIRSISKYGLSQIIIVFRDGSDIYWVRNLVSEKLNSVRDKMPHGVSLDLGPISTGLGEVFMYIVRAREGSALAQKDEFSRLLYLRSVQDYTIRPELKKVTGVADVDSNGGYKKEVHVNISPNRLEAQGVTSEELLQALESVGENAGGGYIEYRGEQVIVRTAGSVVSLAAIKELPVKLRYHGGIVRVKDVADVRFDGAMRLGAATYQGEETVLGTVLMRMGANSRTVAQESESMLKSLTLPDDVEVHALYSRSFLVDATIRTVLKNLAEGAILVVVILLLVLGNFRAAFIVSLAIPISMLAAVLGMEALGVSANLMSLGAIDFGLLVDGSVVLVENTLHKFEDHPKEAATLQGRRKLMFEAIHEVIKPITIGLFIIMLVYVPILGLDGIEGKMFRPMAATVLMALAASLVVSILVMPVLAILVLREPKKGQSKEPLFFRAIAAAYRPSLRFFLRSPITIAGVVLVLLVSSTILFFRLGSDFIPALDEGDGVIMLARGSSTSLSKSIKMQKQSEEIIARFSEVQEVFSRIGTPESATDPMGPNLSDTFLVLNKDKTQWRKHNGKTISKNELLEQIVAAIHAELPDQEASITQPIAMRFNEILEGSRADVTLRIFGHNLDELMRLTAQAQDILDKLPSVSSAELDALTALQKSSVLNVEINQNKMAAYGVSLSRINFALDVAMKGVRAGSFSDEGIRLPVMLHMDEKLRNNPSAILSIPVILDDGGSIQLRNVADLRIKPQVTTIARHYGKRYAAIAIYIKNADISTFVNAAKKAISSGLKLPSGYSVQWAGQFQNLEKAKERLLVVVPVTLVFIFLLLLRSLGSLREALLIYLSVPFAVTGGVIMLWLRGIPFSISATVGFIALTGIAILNTMVLVTFFRQLHEKGMPIDQVVEQGAISRLRPVIMTALVASLGFLPMALNTGLGAEVQRPLATVVIGGLVTSTLLTLIVIPLLYRYFGAPKSKV